MFKKASNTTLQKKSGRSFLKPFLPKTFTKSVSKIFKPFSQTNLENMKIIRKSCVRKERQKHIARIFYRKRTEKMTLKCIRKHFTNLFTRAFEFFTNNFTKTVNKIVQQ